MKKIVICFIFIINLTILSAEKISFSADNIKTQLAFRKLFKLAKKSVIIDKTVNGTVSVSFENVEFENALKMLCMQANCKYTNTNGIYIISSKSYSNFNFNQNYFLKTEIIYLKYVKVEEIIDIVKAAFYDLNISQYESMNAIIVKATDKNIQKIKRFINKLDKLEKQLSIRLRIVQTDSYYLKSLGFNWRDYYVESKKKNDSKLFSNSIFKNYIIGSSGNIFNYTNFATKSKKLSSIMTVLKDEKRLKNVTLQNNIMCLNNKESIIDIGKELVFNKDKRTVILSNRLVIKPRIINKNTIIVNINPTFKTNSSEFSDRFLKEQNVLKTEVRVKDGEEVLIGCFESNYNNSQKQFGLINYNKLKTENRYTIFIFLKVNILKI